jgi:predicted nuclease of predicted toxin-antitoxin system
MKFWVDAQLPPGLAKRLSVQFNVEVVSLRDLGQEILQTPKFSKLHNKPK